MDHEKNISKWLVGILVLLILLGGGYWFYLNKKTTDLTYDKTDGKVAVPEVVKNEPNIIDENNWKYYENKDFGFSFRYPGSYPEPKVTNLECLGAGDLGDCKNAVRIEILSSDTDYSYFEVTNYVGLENNFEKKGSDQLNMYESMLRERDYIKNSALGLVDIAANSVLPFNDENRIAKIVNYNGVKFLNYYKYDGRSISNEYHGYIGSYLIKGIISYPVTQNTDAYATKSPDINNAVNNYNIINFDQKSKDEFGKFDKIMSSFTFASIPQETSLVDDGLKSYTNKNDNFNFSFNYPESWGELSLGTGSAETGVTRSLNFSNKPRIFMGYASNDFSAGRSGFSYELGAIEKGDLRYNSCEVYKDSSTLTSCENLVINGKITGIILKTDKTDLGESVVNGPSIEIYYVTGNEKFPIIGVETDSIEVNDKEITELFKSIKLN